MFMEYNTKLFDVLFKSYEKNLAPIYTNRRSKQMKLYLKDPPILRLKTLQHFPRTTFILR